MEKIPNASLEVGIPPGIFHRDLKSPYCLLGLHQEADQLKAMPFSTMADWILSPDLEVYNKVKSEQSGVKQQATM